MIQQLEELSKGCELCFGIRFLLHNIKLLVNARYNSDQSFPRAQANLGLFAVGRSEVRGSGGPSDPGRKLGLPPSPRLSRIRISFLLRSALRVPHGHMGGLSEIAGGLEYDSSKTLSL